MENTSLVLNVNNVRNINNCTLELDSSKGIYAIVGENGCGKSTIMLLLSLIVKPSSIYNLSPYDYSNDSSVEIDMNGIIDKWIYREQNKKLEHVGKHGQNRDRILNNYYRGFYEGSIFYGSRFYDFQIIDTVLHDENLPNIIMDADDFVKNSMSNILHGDKTHYRTLKKIKTKAIAQEYKFKGMPYFFQKEEQIISQYSMSSGESMLLSLVDFVNNILIRHKPSPNDKIFFFVDEVELALHPSAIDRLLAFFRDIIKQHNIVVYFSTHSSEVIQKIEASKIYLIENHNGDVVCTNPCYPNYAIRNLYIPNGFDYLILVEDELAKAIVDRATRGNRICDSKLICVLPSGDWYHTMRLHKDIVLHNVLGVGKKVISIYDGDVKNEIMSKADFKDYPKGFLPIQSIEKYLLKKLVIEKNRDFIKRIGDKYFTQKSIRDVLTAYESDEKAKRDRNGKYLYKMMLETLKQNGIDDKQFIKYLCEDIEEVENFDAFIQRLSELLG